MLVVQFTSQSSYSGTLQQLCNQTRNNRLHPTLRWSLAKGLQAKQALYNMCTSAGLRYPTSHTHSLRTEFNMSQNLQLRMSRMILRVWLPDEARPDRSTANTTQITQPCASMSLCQSMCPFAFACHIAFQGTEQDLRLLEGTHACSQEAYTPAPSNQNISVTTGQNLKEFTCALRSPGRPSL